MILQEHIDFLKELGCDKHPHEDRTLLEHLIATSNEMKKNGAPQYIQDAGLFHSIYGPAAFYGSGQGILGFDQRDKIKFLIGEEAEELVYEFCSAEKPRSVTFMNMKEGQLKDDLIFLNNHHTNELTKNRQMTWEEAYST